MKKTGIVLLVGMALALGSPAIANEIQVGYPTSPFGPYQSGVGGEFTLNDINGTPNNNNSWLNLSGYVPGTTSNFGPSGISSFQTFCIEVTEHISGYSQTYNAQLNTQAVFGSTATGGDPVSVGTGWLYSQFARGALSGYNYTGNRTASAALLQNAFWWLENEGTTYTPTNPFMVAAFNHFGGEAGARADGGVNYGVFAVNLWTGNNPLQNRAQDQLYYDPGVGVTAVPDDGTTLALLGLALAGVAIVARRFRTA